MKLQIRDKVIEDVEQIKRNIAQDNVEVANRFGAAILAAWDVLLRSLSLDVRAPLNRSQACDRGACLASIIIWFFIASKGMPWTCWPSWRGTGIWVPS